MILMTYSISKVLVGILFVTLAVLIMLIAYRKLLAYLGKGQPVKEDYCVLYSLEQPFASGTVEIYFTTEKPRTVTIEILDENLVFLTLVKEGEFTDGGHIVRFDTTVLANGTYYYCLRSENQKTMKKMEVRNT